MPKRHKDLLWNFISFSTAVFIPTVFGEQCGNSLKIKLQELKIISVLVKI